MKTNHYILSAIKNKLKGIAFRILFFNIILINLPALILLYIDDHEHLLLKELEVDQNMKARVFAGKLAWNEKLHKDNAKKLINQIPRHESDRIQVFNLTGIILYDTGFDTWNWTADIREYRDKPLYKLGTGIYHLFQANRTENTGPASLDTISPSDIKIALSGKGSAKMIRGLSNTLPVVISSTFPVMEHRDVKAIVRILKPANHVLAVVYRIRYKIIVTFLITIIVMIILNLIILQTILKPIRHLTIQSENKRCNEIDIKPLPGQDEISRLSQSFAALTKNFKNEINLNRYFVEDMVHELKNPLSAIRASAETACIADKKEDLNKFMSMISDDVSRMESLLSGVKELSMINTSKAEKKPDPVNITELTAKYINYLKNQTDITFSINFCDNPFYIDIHENRYIQIIDNLLRNAISFSPAKSIVKISLDRMSNWCLLKIQDQGCGISEIHIKKIFNRFYSNRPCKNAGHHTGIGLALVKSIVDSVNGIIEVESIENEGTSFTVFFPLPEKR